MRLAILFLALSVASCLGQAGKTPPIANLVGWWTLNDVTAATNAAPVIDFSGNGANGYLTNTAGSQPGWTGGLIGSALNPGTTLPGEVFIPTNHIGLNNLTSNQITVCVWFKGQFLASIPLTQGLVAKDDGNVLSGWVLQLIASSTNMNSQLIVEKASANTVFTGVPFSEVIFSNSWNFIAYGISNNASLDSLTAAGSIWYQNGSFESPIVTASLGSGAIGSDAKTALTFDFSKFKGSSTCLIDEVRIYNRVLQSWELDAIYHAGYGRAEP